MLIVRRCPRHQFVLGVCVLCGALIFGRAPVDPAQGLPAVGYAGPSVTIEMLLPWGSMVHDAQDDEPPQRIPASLVDLQARVVIAAATVTPPGTVLGTSPGAGEARRNT